MASIVLCETVITLIFNPHARVEETVRDQCGGGGVASVFAFKCYLLLSVTFEALGAAWNFILRQHRNSNNISGSSDKAK